MEESVQVIGFAADALLDDPALRVDHVEVGADGCFPDPPCALLVDVHVVLPPGQDVRLQLDVLSVADVDQPHVACRGMKGSRA